MRKLCFLLDPDKSVVLNVYNACILLNKKLDRDFLEAFLEYWVGGTKASGDDVRKWLEKLKGSHIGPRILFPGKVSQGVLGYDYADLTLVPHLLNWTNGGVFIGNLLGAFISNFYKRKKTFGYLVMSDNSSVGKKIGARTLSHFETIAIIKKFLNNYRDVDIYLEGGSGTKKPVSNRLIKNVSKFVHATPSRKLIVGGGIKNFRQIRDLFSFGVDKVVVGTALEKNDTVGSFKIMYKLLKPFEDMWKKGKLSTL